MQPRILLVVLALAGGCFDSRDNRVSENPPGSIDGKAISGTEGTEPVVINDILDNLSTIESQGVCATALDKTDLCTQRGFLQPTADACQRTVDQCRKEKADIDLYASCKGVSYGEPGNCQITPAQYYGCVDAFEKMRTCGNLEKDLVAPAACQPVIQQCILLADQFGRQPAPVPQCGTTTSAQGDPRDDEDIYGAESCFPLPKRFVVLGDSISKCDSYAERIEDCNCSWKNIAGYLRDMYADDLSIEGCYPADEIRGTIEEVADDVHMIAGGPGHIAVWISAIAWDLMQLGEVEQAVPVWLEDWQRVFDYFNDKSRFPDGATFLLNTIYNPTDNCPESEKDTAFTNLTLAEDNNIRYAIENVLIHLAQERDDTVTVDIYPDWLGHGHNFDVDYCPFYGAEKQYWMSDHLHPNNAGYLHIAEQWRRALDRIYGENCQ